MTSASCSTPAASPCGAATTAPGRCTTASEYSPRPGRRSTCTPRARRSTRWWRAWATCRSSSEDDHEGGGSLPGDHPRPLPGQAPQRPAGAVRGRGAPREHQLWGRGAAARRPGRRRGAGRLLRGRGLLDLPGLDLGDDRSGDRPGPPARAGPARRVRHSDAGQGRDRAGRRAAGGRDCLRRRRPLSGPGEVCAAGLVRVQGCGAPGRERREARRTSMTQRPSELVRDDLPDVGPDGLTTKPTLADIEEALKDVVDPELGINVVDLGLIYGLHLEDDDSLTIDMTLTSAACPLTDVIEDQTDTALEGLVDRFVINWVWMPPWGMEKITDDGRDQLRALGFNV